MGHLTINNKILDKYFRFLINLDIKSKKRLIIKLTESIETAEESDIDLNNLYGAWKDNEQK